ncbi:uncharacterized protein FPRO_16018 [Fusarium proliferatum ET1]|uniref:Uncharacterized protein n=1 Tax=Fusarium proliferatum (strain ET1) TaxID=1227346 RepID=A0A1L7WB29_FUSPR|nr:uncharacterized protein FPRO_16018 [Fusarium proliferatum ET1]CZR49810.1 uncharacterized protein FPRO_16018 [Fusarium proliferatum ET1]
MENIIVLEIKRGLSGFRDEIRNDLRAFRESIRGLQSDVDTNTKDIRKLRNTITKEKTVRSQENTELREALDYEFKSIDDRFRDVHQRFDELRTENVRVLANVQNGKLSNPFLPIQALPVYLPKQGITYPEATYFPKNANEFYALKQPSSPRQTAMLAYLAMFYDISHYQKHGDTAIGDPVLAVEYLENILGLVEDNFTRFKERAREVDARPKAAPIKRAEVCDVEQLFPHKRQHSRHSSESQFTYKSGDKLGWRVRSLSNPTEDQPTMAGLAKKYRDWARRNEAPQDAYESDETSGDEGVKKVEDSGSTTNINTSRDGGSEQEQVAIRPNPS